MKGNYFNGPMWMWFGLTRASYLVIPRALLCGLHDPLQEKLVAVLDEIAEVYDSSKIKDKYTVNLREGRKFISDPLRDYRHPPELPYKEEDI